jgi:hypothetical protein
MIFGDMLIHSTSGCARSHVSATAFENGFAVAVSTAWTDRRHPRITRLLPVLSRRKRVGAALRHCSPNPVGISPALFARLGQDLRAALMVLGGSEPVRAVEVRQGAQPFLLAARLGLRSFRGLDLAKSIKRPGMNAIQLGICRHGRAEWICDRRSRRRSLRRSRSSLLSLRALKQSLASAVFKFFRILRICSSRWAGGRRRRNRRRGSLSWRRRGRSAGRWLKFRAWSGHGLLLLPENLTGLGLGRRIERPATNNARGT